MVATVEAKKQMINPSNWEEVNLFCREWWEELKPRLPAIDTLATIGQHGARVEDDVRIFIFNNETKRRYQFIVEPGSKRWGLFNLAMVWVDKDNLLPREFYFRSYREDPNPNLCLDVVMDEQGNLLSLRNTLPWISVSIFKDSERRVVREMQRENERYITDLEPAVNLTIAEFKLDLVRLPNP